MFWLIFEFINSTYPSRRRQYTYFITSPRWITTRDWMIIMNNSQESKYHQIASGSMQGDGPIKTANSCRWLIMTDDIAARVQKPSKVMRTSTAAPPRPPPRAPRPPRPPRPRPRPRPRDRFCVTRPNIDTAVAFCRRNHIVINFLLEKYWWING